MRPTSLDNDIKDATTSPLAFGTSDRSMTASHPLDIREPRQSARAR
jgi:hypothetical protein